MMKKFEMWELAKYNRDTKQAYAIGRTADRLAWHSIGTELQFVKTQYMQSAINEVP